MIENELRDLLADRAGTVSDNPARTREVHALVGRIRRRRTAGAPGVRPILTRSHAIGTKA